MYFEVLTNPLLQVNNVTKIAEIAHRYGAISIVDNTFVTPYLQLPLDQGADIVIHSATKYLAGHSEVNAGLVVVKDDGLGKRVYFAQNRLGGVLAPNECDSVRRGIQTLALRMDRQQENARAISSYLLLHPLVKSVHYPGLSGHEYEIWTLFRIATNVAHLVHYGAVGSVLRHPKDAYTKMLLEASPKFDEINAS